MVETAAPGTAAAVGTVKVCSQDPWVGCGVAYLDEIGRTADVATRLAAPDVSVCAAVEMTPGWRSGDTYFARWSRQRRLFAPRPEGE